MNIQKLTNYLVIGLGVLGAVFLGALLKQNLQPIFQIFLIPVEYF